MDKKFLMRYERPPSVNLHEKQRAFVDDRRRFVFVEAGTKSGKTIGMIIYANEFIIRTQVLRPGRLFNVWWIAPTANVARIAMDRWWRDYIPTGYKRFFKRHITHQYIEYPGGARVYFKGAEVSDSLYGEDVDLAIIDEASRVKEDSFKAVISTLTYTNGFLRCIGNMKGRANWFYKQCKAAEKNGNGHHILTSYDNPFNDKKAIEDAKMFMSPEAHAELFSAKAMDYGDRPFSVIDLDKSLIPHLSSRPTTSLGIDIGVAVDYTVIIGFDDQCQMTYFDRFRQSREVTVEKLKDAILHNKPEICLVDATGLNNNIAKVLVDEYPDIVRPIIITRDNSRTYDRNTYPRQILINDYSAMISTGRIKFPMYIKGHGEVMYEEFFNFEYAKTYSGHAKIQAIEGSHDDCVMSGALGSKGLNILGIRYNL